MGSQPTEHNEEKERLEIEKLKLEGEKLQLEVESLKKGFHRTVTITSITAVVSVFVATGGWIIDRERTRVAQRDDLFAKALENLASDSSVRRISGVASLAQFRDRRYEEVIQTLSNRILTEEDIPVLEQIALTLGHMGSAALQPCVVANRRAAAAFVYECGRYAAGDVKHYEKALRDIDKTVSWGEVPFVYSGLIRSRRRGARALDVLIRSAPEYRAELEMARASSSEFGPPGSSEGLIKIEKKWNQLVAASAAIGQLLRNLPHPDVPMELSNIVLIDVDLRNLNLAGANLRGAMLSGPADNVDLNCSDLSNANLSEAWLRGANLFYKLRCGDTVNQRENGKSDPCKIDRYLHVLNFKRRLSENPQNIDRYRQHEASP